METREALDIMKKMLGSAQSTDEFQAISASIDALLQVRAFEEGEQGKWIPVDTYMPKKMGYYLISRGGVVEKDVFSDFKKDFLHDDADAWQLLPAPYKKGEKK